LPAKSAYYSDRLLELNNLKKIYDQEQNQRRGSRNKGQQQETSVGWIELFGGAEDDASRLWEMLLKPRPLPRVSEQFLRDVRERWLQTAKPQHSNTESPKYLEILGLPPNASTAEVATRDLEHRNQAKEQLIKKVRELAHKQKSGKITTEEYEAETARPKEANNKFLAELNDLKKNYGEEQVHRGRSKAPPSLPELLGLAADASADAVVASYEQYRRKAKSMLEEEFRAIELRLKKSEITNARYKAEIEQLTAAYDRHMSELGKLKQSYDAVGDRQTNRRLTSREDPPSNIADVCRLINERGLIRLLWADALWMELSGTNREYWYNRVRAWFEEIEEIGPHFRTRAANGAPAYSYPHLSQPRKLTIEHLEKGQAEDGPCRPEGGEQTFDLQKFMQLAHSLKPEELERFLEFLAAAGREGRSGARGASPGALEGGTQ
jgi:hypothetical protein